jgi:hypothetical protein
MTGAGDGAVNAAWGAVQAVRETAWHAVFNPDAPRTGPDLFAEQKATEERAAQCQIMRDVLGNPFRPLPPRKGRRAWEEQFRRWREWNERAAFKLAEVIYREARFDDTPVLADALEDAGCAEAAILEHLRSPGPHVRGCWALSLLLGQE